MKDQTTIPLGLSVGFSDKSRICKKHEGDNALNNKAIAEWH
jgi:hypothetical protein